MTREEFDVYLKKFNSRDYDGFLDYFADVFEMIHVGGSFKTRESIKKFYAFLHNYIKESVIVGNLDASNRRNQWTSGAVVGAGMSYRWGNGNFSLETKYFHSMANITNGAERFKNPSLFYGFYFLDDDLRLNNLAIAVGYSFFLNYKVIKSK